MPKDFSNSKYMYVFKENDIDIAQLELDHFALAILNEDIEKLILRFPYIDDRKTPKDLNLTLLFNSILQNPHIKCLSIQGFYYLNYNELKCLRTKDINLEFKYGVRGKVKEIIQLTNELKSITHFELGIKTSPSEQLFLELIQSLHKHPLSSLILPVPKEYSDKSRTALKALLTTKPIKKFGFSSSCRANDVLLLLGNTKITNLGFYNIEDLTIETCRKIFSLIKNNLQLTHFTLHNVDEDCANTIFEELSQLTYLESILLDIGYDTHFIIDNLPYLIRVNLNLRSIEIVHMDERFTIDLTQNYIVHNSLYHAPNKNPSLINFKILQHNGNISTLFPDGDEGGITLLNYAQAITYCKAEIINRNKIINEPKNPKQQEKLKEYLSIHNDPFNEFKVKPLHWEKLLVPPLYYLALQQALTFFRKNPEKIAFLKKLPDKIIEDLTCRLK